MICFPFFHWLLFRLNDTLTLHSIFNSGCNVVVHQSFYFYIKSWFLEFSSQWANLSAIGLNECHCSPFNDFGGLLSTDRRVDGFLPEISPDSAPQPLLPLLAPTPLAPFTNSTVPKLSGSLVSFDLDVIWVERPSFVLNMVIFSFCRTMHIKFHCCPKFDEHNINWLLVCFCAIAG